MPTQDNNKRKTLEEFKQGLSKENGFRSFAHFLSDKGVRDIEQLIDQANALFYAQEISELKNAILNTKLQHHSECQLWVECPFCNAQETDTGKINYTMNNINHNDDCVLLKVSPEQQDKGE